MDNLEILKKLAKNLKINNISIYFGKDNILTCELGKNVYKGYGSIVLCLAKETRLLQNPMNLEEEADIRQWVEYANKFNCQSAVKYLLLELNRVLENRTFLTSNKYTVADIAMYYSIIRYIAKSSPQDKAEHVHVSRWLNNIQHCAPLDKSVPFVNFNTNYVLVSIAASH